MLLTGRIRIKRYLTVGYWSRRITIEHRLVYTVTENSIVIISCRYHYF
ncbi:MAG: type II toxin-antitoxin system YoeB family toxin [Bacteroidia bacterium]|nr:type II toxin-antitoxin system YoeB family toxin [Bacteroidia bacterium]